MSDGSLEKPILDLKESVERKIHSFRDEIISRFDDQAARLERHADPWQTGCYWSTGMDQWAEKVDAALESKDKQIAELNKRVNELEKKERAWKNMTPEEHETAKRLFWEKALLVLVQNPNDSIKHAAELADRVLEEWCQRFEKEKND